VILRIIAQGFEVTRKIKNRILMRCYGRLFRSHGRRFVFSPTDFFSYHTIVVGDDVYIGPGAYFSAVKGISIGNGVMFGPHVSIVGGDHNTELTGQPMFKNHVKRETDDLPITICDDVWVGTGATILKGVTVGRGAIIAAASVVTRNVAPYSVVAGCPARVIRMRGTAEQVIAHEQKCYAEPDRLDLNQLKHLPENL
jgi:acetyltransferase-like isoleucine patch superfamily enzyme